MESLRAESPKSFDKLSIKSYIQILLIIIQLLSLVGERKKRLRYFVRGCRRCGIVALQYCEIHRIHSLTDKPTREKSLFMAFNLRRTMGV